MNETLEFIERFRHDSTFKGQILGGKKLHEMTAEALTTAAQQFGYHFSADDLLIAADSYIRQADLTDEELEAVAGGHAGQFC
jgi:predicted ribosomally synthesized peptide with nif11-like leader